jgi:hypothetical protein
MSDLVQVVLARIVLGDGNGGLLDIMVSKLQAFSNFSKRVSSRMLWALQDLEAPEPDQVIEG